MTKIIFFFFSLLMIEHTLAYVINKSEGGENVKWNKVGSSLNILINPSPVKTDLKLDKTEETIEGDGYTLEEYITLRTKEIVDESISQWNAYSPYQVNQSYSSNLPQAGTGTNTLRYTSDYAYFGSGIIAVTSLSYGAESGSILHGDILINQSSSLSTTLSLDPAKSSNNYAYLGDVLTHEFGHFLGLSHSEVTGSTMTYSIFKGQSTLHKDDIAGVLKNYSESLDDGAFYGRVIGGENTPLFGMQVEVFSATLNQIIQSQVTNSDGEFYIENLPIDDTFFLKVTPLKNLSTLPDFYKNVSNKTCYSNSFKPSFYTSCGARGKGRPQLVSFQSDYIDLGDITVRCDERLNTDYFSNKQKTSNRSFSLMDSISGLNSVFYGYFSKAEVEKGTSGSGDEFEVDLTQFDFSDEELSSGYLRVNINVTDHKGRYGLVLYSKRSDEDSFTKTGSSVESETGKLLTQLQIDLPLSMNHEENVFKLLVFPEELTSDQAYGIFASPANLSLTSSLYSIVTNVGLGSGTSFVKLENYPDYDYSDNQTCPEGNITYSSRPYISSSTYSTGSNDDEGLTGLSCGTIDISSGQGPKGGGPASLVLGLILVLIGSKFSNKFDKFLS